jgi:hypothetical protein
MLWSQGLRPECPPNLAEREIAARLASDRMDADEADREERWAWMMMASRRMASARR